MLGSHFVDLLFVLFGAVKQIVVAPIAIFDAAGINAPVRFFAHSLPLTAAVYFRAAAAIYAIRDEYIRELRFYFM